MKKTATARVTPRRARAARSTSRRSAAALTPELLPVQVLRDLLVEAWLGAIADGGQPARARTTRAPRAPRAARGSARARAAAAPAGRHAPIRERILAEMERQAGFPARPPHKNGGR